MKIDYRVDDRARAILSSLGRTEDVRFSPDNRRIAIASFYRGKIALLNIQIGGEAGSPAIALTGGIEISSPALRQPHGVDFIDDETLVVANREGGVAIFRVPAAQARDCELSPIQLLEPRKGSIVYTPGSVSVVHGEDGRCELLVCNNYADSVSRHAVDRSAGCAITRSDVLLGKWLNLPDGICASRDGRWIARSAITTRTACCSTTARSR